jgi:DNA invertase Pin-like site-specific DNA recombinase
MKAFGYLRVSGQGQVSGDGFPRQREAIESYSKKYGYTVVQWFQDEGVSGTLEETHRPAFQDMVQVILKNGVQTVIVEGLDRLAREYRIQETLLIYLASKGITLLSARTEENVTEAIQADPMKKALIQIQGVFSELEKSLLVKKLRAARERKRQLEGKCEGRKSIKEQSPEVLKVIKSLRKTKPGQKRRSYNEIAQELNRRGLYTVSGKPFSGSNVQKILSRF